MSNTNPSFNANGVALVPYAMWLQLAGPRITANHATIPLPRLVEAVITELVDAEESFTAYDVTTILRTLFPGNRRVIPHYDRHGAPGVQPEVHRQMAGYVLSGIYATQTAYPNGVDPARLYVPCTRRPRGGWRAAAASIFGARSGTAPLPAGAWVVKNTPRR